MTGPSLVVNQLRKISRQHVRKALVDATIPFRALPLPVARPLSSTMPTAASLAYSVREAGPFGHVPVDFGQDMKNRSFDQESRVFTIDGSQSTFQNRHALDRDRRVLYQRDFPFGNLPIALQRLEPIQATYPSVAYLSNTLPSNYYHWLILVLPMLRYYQAAGIEIDRVYVGEALNAWQKRSLEYAGIEAENVVTEPCAAEVGHVAVLTRHAGGVCPEQIRWARSLFVDDELKPGTRRLFVGRGQSLTRRMVDEEVIAAKLEDEFDFEYLITSDMTLDDEIDLFGRAGAIVSPNGAALTNMLFSPRGTKVLELHSFDNDYSLAHCYREMSAAIGHRHGAIRGEQTRRRKNGSSSDIKVAVDVIMRETEKMLASN